ncbi:hypothetical protein GSY71_00055 [Pusillimonas sp. TS35]|uniref:LPS-assembly lipoprotein LptE n=1 Tax=Paracandidimonas lactea TaxID=2895524 RepID=UPI001368E5EB|nr:LPS assembly lipoprotein LptE [Paracandidimonas lactea]MYN11551.1 hypothetical protein [Pusillimonas sp. TS35]
MHRPTPSPATTAPWRTLRFYVCAALLALVAACGFRLKGVAPLPFNTLYTNIPNNTEFGANLRRAIVASSPNTRFVESAAEAQARLTQISNRQWLRELSLDARGLVEEYELNLEFVFQLTDDKGHVVLPPTTLRDSREIPYDPDTVQAKQGEIETNFKQMRAAMINRILRHLSAPDVSEAFSNPSELPVDTLPAPDAPVGHPRTTTPSPWYTPSMPGAGRY